MKKLIILFVLLLIIFVGCGQVTTNQQETSNNNEQQEVSDNYPTKPIHVILQFNPGGGGDQMLIALQPEFERRLGQPLVIDYKPGANTQIGYELLAAAEPDGYTIGFLTTPHLQLTQITQEPNYKIEDFVPIGTHHMDSVIFYTQKGSPIQSMSDLIEAAKEKPGKIVVATGTIASDMGIAIKALEKAAGVQFSIIPTAS